MKKFTIPAVLALSLAACNDADFSQKKDYGTTIATVNGINILQEEVNQQVQALPANLVAGKEQEILNSTIARLVEKELVLQDADMKNISKDEEFMKLQQEALGVLAYNYMLNKVAREAVTEDTLKAEYEATKDQFTFPAVKARHILLKTEADAKKVIKSLEKGADFAKTAEKKSTGPSAKTGGDLGWFKPGDMVPAFSKAAFQIEPGTFSKEPVQTQFGFHVILVEDRKDGNIPPIQMVQRNLETKLSEKAIREYLESLKEGAKVEMVKPEEKTAEAPAAEGAESKAN